MDKFVAFVALAALALAGCAGEEAGPGTAGPQTVTEEQTVTEAPPVQLEGPVNDHGTQELTGDRLEMEADDFYFAPTYVRAQPAATVAVEVFNEGDATHTFTIDGQDVDVEVAPGERTTVQVEVPDRAHLRYYCRFHEGQGMQGAFVVD
ncbi:MAG: cupredoxin domain-containing protein [Actinomycetota bacterium]|nr:cupredoxin domain-containing protein [Actinomycetota bacterium]